MTVILSDISKENTITDIPINICRETIIKMMTEVLTDVMQVFDFGAQKHPDSGDTPNFLTPNGNKCALKDRGSSILRHAAQCFGNVNAKDDESNLPHILHLLASASILYIRHKRNISHPNDRGVK
jgi:hypothetical protein